MGAGTKHYLKNGKEKQVRSTKVLIIKCLMDKYIQVKNILKIVSVYIKQRKDNGNIPR